MTYALAILAAMVAAVVGWFVTGIVTVWIAGLYGVSDFEGQRGMFAFLGVGPLGGLACMLGAAWIVLRVHDKPAPTYVIAGRLLAVLGAIVAIVAAGIWLRLQTV